MKKTAILLALCMLLCACAAAEPQLTPHELAMQKLIADAPLWAGEGVRLDLHQDERLPVLAAPFFPMTEVDPGPYRGANDRAEVSLNEPFTVLAVSPYSGGEWLLISYEVREGENRIGWICASEALAPDCAEAMCRENEILWAGRDTIVTDDPFGSRRVLDRIERDEEVWCIGWVGAYAYVKTGIDGRFAFGFVPLADLEDPADERLEENEKDGLVGAWRFSGGAESLDAGIVFDENGRYMLCGADNWAVFPPENLRLRVEASGEYEVVKNDRPVGGEFWDEAAPFAIVLRDDEQGVKRLVCTPENGAQGERLLLTAGGEGGDYYSRMQGAEADKLLADLTGMWIIPLRSFSDGWVSGKVGVIDRHDLRMYMKPAKGAYERENLRKMRLYSNRINWDDAPGVCFGEAVPSESDAGVYTYEGELPEGTYGVDVVAYAGGNETTVLSFEIRGVDDPLGY